MWDEEHFENVIWSETWNLFSGVQLKSVLYCLGLRIKRGLTAKDAEVNAKLKLLYVLFYSLCLT